MLIFWEMKWLAKNIFLSVLSENWKLLKTQKHNKFWLQNLRLDILYFPKWVLIDLSVIAVTIPAMIIVVSYSSIWIHMWKNHQYLKQQGTTCTKNLLNRSESRTAWTVTIVVSCYFLFVLPQPIKDIILNYLDENSTFGLYLD